MKALRSLSELLRSGDISELQREARRRRALADEIRSALTPDEAAHVVGAHVDPEGVLVVSVDSAAWAARLRFARPDGRPVRVRVAPPGNREIG